MTTQTSERTPTTSETAPGKSVGKAETKAEGKTETKAEGKVDKEVKAKAKAKPVPASFLQAEALPDGERPKYISGRAAAERSPEQIRVDGHVKESHTAWIAGGKTEVLDGMPWKRYVVPAEHVEGIKEMIRAAARFHNVSVRVPTPSRHTSGHMSVAFCATDTRKRAPKDKDKSEDKPAVTEE